MQLQPQSLSHISCMQRWGAYCSHFKTSQLETIKSQPEDKFSTKDPKEFSSGKAANVIIANYIYFNLLVNFYLLGDNTATSLRYYYVFPSPPLYRLVVPPGNDSMIWLSIVTWFLLYGLSQKGYHSCLLSFSSILSPSFNTHLSLPWPFCSHSHLSLSSILCLPPFFPSSILPPSIFESQYQSPSVSLCLELIWRVFPDHQTSSFSISLSLIISLCTRLNSHMRGKEEIAEVDQRMENERRGGRMGWWRIRGLREQGFSYSVFSGSWRLQSTSWCIIQVSLTSAIFVPLFTTTIFQSILCLLYLTLFYFPSVSLFTSPPSFYLLLSHLLCPLSSSLSFSLTLIVFRGRAVRPFNRSEEVLEVWWELPLSKSPAENHSILWSSLSVRQTDFISTVLNLPALLPNCLNELVPRFTSTWLSLVWLIWEYRCS